MKEIDKVFITDGGYVLLKDVSGNYHSLEIFKDIDSRANVIRAFQGQLSHPLRHDQVISDVIKEAPHQDR